MPSDLLAILQSSAQEKHRDFSNKLKISDFPEQVLGVPLPRLREIGRDTAKAYPSLSSLLKAVEKGLDRYVEMRSLFILAGCRLCRTQEDWLVYLDQQTRLLDGWANSDLLLGELGKKLHRTEVSTAFTQLFNAQMPNPYALRLFVTLNMYQAKHGKKIKNILADLGQTEHAWDLLTLRQAVAWTLATLSIEHFDVIYQEWYCAPLSPEHPRKEQIEMTLKLYRQKMRESKRIPREYCALLLSNSDSF